MTIDGAWSCRRARQHLCDLCVCVCCKTFVCRHTGHSLIFTLLSDGAALICFPPNSEERPLLTAVYVIMSNVYKWNLGIIMSWLYHFISDIKWSWNNSFIHCNYFWGYISSKNVVVVTGLCKLRSSVVLWRFVFALLMKLGASRYCPPCRCERRGLRNTLL